MKANKCDKFVYISFTPESVTFIEGQINEKLWDSVWKVKTDLYSTPITKPTRRHPDVKDVLTELKRPVHLWLNSRL